MTINIINQVKNIIFWYLEFSKVKKYFMANTSIINLINPNALSKLIKKFVLKIEFISNEIQKIINA